MNPRKAIARGLVAGVAGTAAMTAAQELAARLQKSGEGGSGEPSEQDPWEGASPPAKVGKRVLEGVFRKEVGPEKITVLTQSMHWGYGTAWGAVFGVMAADRDGSSLRHGLGFGLVVWVASYLQLVPMGLYEPPWRYHPRQVATEVGYHLAYGAGLGVGWSLLDRRR